MGFIYYHHDISWLLFCLHLSYIRCRFLICYIPINYVCNLFNTMIIDIVFFFLLSFGISFAGCMLLWLNMSFFIDGMIHSLLLASVLYSAFCIDSFLAIFLVMTLYITILTLLGKVNNTNLIISSQTLTIIALVLKDD